MPPTSPLRSFATAVAAGAVLAWFPVVAAEVDAAAPAPVAPRPAAAAAATPGRKLDDATVERLLKLQESEHVTVRLVLVPANVHDRKGRVVRGLESGDFRLMDQRVPQKIEYFSVEGDAPVAIAFLLDVSSSMRYSGKLDAAKEAIRHFVDSLRPQDRFALIAFADEQVAWITDFTSDRHRFLERLMVQEGFGQTALNDAVAATPGMVDRSAEGRKAIVLITDGVDNASRLTTAQAVDLARRVEVPIYTLGFSAIPAHLRDKTAPSPGFEVLKHFSDETGGSLFAVHDPDELKEAVVRINTELRYQYLIGYHPAEARWDGRFREIKLETTRSRYLVKTRKGYYATP